MFIELSLVTPLLVFIVLFFVFFAVGAGSIGTVARDAYVASLLGTQNPLPQTVPLERFLVGHQRPATARAIAQHMVSSGEIDPTRLSHLSFLNYVAGEASRRADPVGFLPATTYTSTSISIQDTTVAGRDYSRKSVHRRLNLLGMKLTVSGTYSESL